MKKTIFSLLIIAACLLATGCAARDNGSAEVTPAATSAPAQVAIDTRVPTTGSTATPAAPVIVPVGDLPAANATETVEEALLAESNADDAPELALPLPPEL